MQRIQTESNKIGRLIFKAAASLARGIARDSIENHCFLFIHEPKKPKDFVRRLKTMQ